MSTREGRTVAAKVGDWETAYLAVRDELTVPQLREWVNKLTDQEMPNNPAEVAGYISLVQTSLAAVKVVAANDRAAAVVAAMLTQNGVSRPTLSVVGEED